jgi:hypothetical protein
MAAELADRLAILVAFRRFPSMDAKVCRLLRSESCVRMQHIVRRSTYVSFRRFLSGVRREFVQRLSVALPVTLGSYPRDDLQEGSVDVMACLNVPRA